MKLNGTGKSLGPWKTIKVKKDDKISAEVFALYKSNATSTGVNWNAYLSNTANLSGGAESGKNVPLLQAGFTLSPPDKHTNTTLPKAYLKVNFFKEDQTIATGSQASLTVLVNATSLNAWKPYTTVVTAPYDGYVQIFLANESNTDVWFDNLTITCQEPKVVQENAYSAFGNGLAGIDTKGQPDDKYQYNGKEKQEEHGLNWIDYGARMYDAQLGRWHSIDPLAFERDWLSPYQYVQNNPISRNDPTGLIDIYALDAESGEIRKKQETNDKTDKLVDSKTNKVVDSSVKKGILKDKMNIKENGLETSEVKEGMELVL